MAYYDDPQFQYSDFWSSREYEHRSELIALDQLLGGRKFTTAVDIGGGFGRLTRWLAGRCQKVYLVEPSVKMRQLARKKLGQSPRIFIRAGQAQDTNLPKSCAELVIMVRVLHHLPNPGPAIEEIRRILKPKGLVVVEFANSLHFMARIKSWLTGRPILPGPVEKRHPGNIAAGTIPYVNHHPVAVQKQLLRQGFRILKILSVSNFRKPVVKKLIPINVLLGLESRSQESLAALYFGPSIFILAQKIDN